MKETIAILFVCAVCLVTIEILAMFANRK